MKNVLREVKLNAIVDTFHVNAKLLASTGEDYIGKEAIKAFYANVLEKSNDTFEPRLNENSVCYSETGIFFFFTSLTEAYIIKV